MMHMIDDSSEFYVLACSLTDSPSLMVAVVPANGRTLPEAALEYSNRSHVDQVLAGAWANEGGYELRPIRIVPQVANISPMGAGVKFDAGVLDV